MEEVVLTLCTLHVHKVLPHNVCHTPYKFVSSHLMLLHGNTLIAWSYVRLGMALVFYVKH